jgi:predicted secreted protein
MRIQSMIAVYFVIWWITLFVVLPFGVKNASEEGVVVEEGHEPGAPVRTMLLKKAAINTVVAGIVFAGVYYAYTHGVFG